MIVRETMSIFWLRRNQPTLTCLRDSSKYLILCSTSQRSIYIFPPAIPSHLPYCLLFISVLLFVFSLSPLMAPTTQKEKEIAPSCGSDKNRKTHFVQRKDMKSKIKHSVQLAIKMESLSSDPKRKYSVREANDFTSIFALNEKGVRRWVKEVLQTYSKLIHTQSLKVGVSLDWTIVSKNGGTSVDTPYTHLTLRTESHSLTVYLLSNALCKPW